MSSECPVTSEVLQKIKLSVFPPGHFGPGIEEDIFLNEDDFPNIKVGDILEIGQTDFEHEDERPRLLLMVRSYLNLLVDRGHCFVQGLNGYTCETNLTFRRINLILHNVGPTNVGHLLYFEDQSPLDMYLFTTYGYFQLHVLFRPDLDSVFRMKSSF